MPAKRKAKLSSSWFVMGLVGILLAAPNATVVKVATDALDPFVFNALRFALIGVVTLPFFLRRGGRYTRKGLKYALIAGFCMAVATTCAVWSIKLSQASYFSIISLIAPIFLVLFSRRLNAEKITARAVAGITLAALGALIIVVLPIAVSHGAFTIHPLATVIAFVTCVLYPMSTIYFKKANEAGIPIVPAMSISAWVVCLVSVIILVPSQPVHFTLDAWTIGTIGYSAFVVALFSRVLIVKSYEHIGSAVTSALSYFETFIAILIPVFVLGEHISLIAVFGGIIVLLGLYIVEHHKSVHHKYSLVHRSH